MKKCGLTAYQSSGESLKKESYAQIVDESMMIGNEKLLLTLGVPAEHKGRPLNSNDVSILDIAVANSWNGEAIGAQLKIASQKVGYDPSYVISDNASTIKKGVRCAEFNHQLDISHSLGMFLKRVYGKAPDFNNYIKLMTASKFRFGMTNSAYLLPPNQRTVARFLNISGWVRWSSRMLNIYPTLKADHQKVFSYIPTNRLLINELIEVTECVRMIEYLCKNEGLSTKTVDKCKEVIKKRMLYGNTRMVQLGETMIEYLTNEVKLVAINASHNNSSDIIESLFGKYKSRISPNKLYGVTSLILLMPIYTKLNEDTADEFDVKAALESTRMEDVATWEKKNLTQNLMQLREKCLKKSA